MLYLKAQKKLECGCIFYVYITYCIYHCKAIQQCEKCTYEQLEKNENILEEEFNINLIEHQDYTNLILLNWTVIEKSADENLKFVED